MLARFPSIHQSFTGTSNRAIMIIGLGVDLCDVRRINAALERHGERFAQRILSDAELQTFRARMARWPERGPRYLATRFAAKEAFSKAVGLGMRMPMTWRTCEVAKAASGAPSIVLHGALGEWFHAKRWRAHLTLTDEGDMAAAFVVVESIADNPSP
jgi:holo-[acyl-carrier protein] synthase